MINLGKIRCNRIFVIGNVSGDYHKLIDILYEQNFTKNDILVSTGDFTLSDNLHSIDVLLFFMNNVNTIGLLGKNEYDLLQLLQEQKIDQLPLWVKNYPNIQEIENYLINLPAIIQLDSHYHIVNRGVDASKRLEEQDPKVFYSIGKYDKDSRYYQNSTKSWYEEGTCFGQIIFSGIDAGAIDAGNSNYCLYSDMEKDKPLKCLIYHKPSGAITFVESVGNLLNSKQAAVENFDKYKKMLNDLKLEKPNVNPKQLGKMPPINIDWDKYQNMLNDIENEQILDQAKKDINNKPVIYDEDQTKRIMDKQKKDINKQKKLLITPKQKIIDEEKALEKKQPKIKEKEKYLKEDYISPEQQEALDRAKEEFDTVLPVAAPDMSEFEAVPEVKDYNEENFQLTTFKTPDEYISAGGRCIDVSIGALLYLQSLGYQSGTWALNETHDESKCLHKVDGNFYPKGICRENSGKVFNLSTEIIQFAKAHKGAKGYNHPPATVFAHSHPCCKCRYILSPPTSIDQIPNTAPHLPMNASPDIIADYKQKLLSRLPIMEISAYVSPIDNRFAVAYLNNLIDITKTASTENWVEEIKPIKITKSIYAEIGLGLQHPVNEGDIGFVLKQSEDKAQIYSYEFHRIFTVPIDAIRIVDLKKSDAKPRKGQFILTEDDILGILYRVDDTDNFIVYLPEVEITTIINKVQMLDFF